MKTAFLIVQYVTRGVPSPNNRFYPICTGADLRVERVPRVATPTGTRPTPAGAGSSSPGTAGAVQRSTQFLFRRSEFLPCRPVGYSTLQK